MKKQNLKKSKLIYLLISIVASVFLWVYVVTVVSTETTESFYNIPVSFTGLDELRDDDLTITDGLKETVSLRLTGRRSMIQQLTKENIIITVDVSMINAPGEYSRGYSISYSNLSQNNGISVSQQVPQTVDIVVEELITRRIPVKTVFNGTVEDGYAVDSVVASYDYVTVVGTQNQIGDIYAALIILDDRDLNRTTSSDRSYTFVTIDGETVDGSALEVDAEQVGVTINVVKFKTIPLVMAFNPGGGATDAHVDWTADPPTITVSGDEEDLDKLNYILLGTQNLSALVADTTATYPVIIPDGVTNETGIAEATVTMKLNGLTSKTLKVSSSNISLTNAPSGYVGTSVTQSLEITVRGPSEDVSTILPSEIRVVADLSGLSSAAGTYKIENVAIYLEGHPNSGVMGSYTVMVTLMTEQDYLASLAEAEEGETAENNT